VAESWIASKEGFAWGSHCCRVWSAMADLENFSDTDTKQMRLCGAGTMLPRL
jgi:hypothetical protein